MSKVSYKDVKITKKYKDCCGYFTCEGTLTRVHKNLFKTKEDGCEFIFDDGVRTRLIKINNEARIKVNNTLYEDIMKSAESVIFDGDCCLHPDLEECNTYPIHDILYAYILDKYEVLDYDFVGMNETEHNKEEEYFEGYIKFKDDKYEYEYPFDVESKISTHACLHCKSVIKDDERKLLRMFDNWVATQRYNKDRKKQASMICKENGNEF